MQTLKQHGLKGREGYWATHKFHRRSVEDLQVESFCGWRIFLDLIEACNDKDRYTPYHFPYCSERDKALISAAFETGGRISEVLKLRKKMFTISDEWVLVENMPLLKRFKKRKILDKETEETITVTKPIPTTRDFVFRRSEPLSEFVVAWIDQRNDYLFPSYRKSRFPHIHPTRAYEIVTELAKKINYEMWPHRIRSERASQLGREYKWSLEKIMRFFGWKTTSMAIRYAHAGIEDMKAAMPHIEYSI